ncbi:putative lactoylglutathione lyase [Marmoricola sp. OAE513]|uniref:glyoxalase n=1 Tax=Marmoricola sp. OAE513 TaxID=2817894 RepID=UPI001AEB83D0
MSTAVSVATTVVLESGDVAGTEAFVSALGATGLVGARATAGESSGFRGFTLSLVCSQPADVDALVEAATGAGASVLKAATKSFWGYGAVVQAPDGTVWKLAASSKKNTGPAATSFEDLVLLLGVADVKASRKFYADQGVGTAKSFGVKYAELETSGVTVALYPRKAAAKDAGVPVEGSGSHRVAVRNGLGGFTDPDGFVWETA